MRILGIDPGSRVTGFGVIDTDGVEDVEVVVHQLPDRVRVGGRGKPAAPVAAIVRVDDLANGLQLGL